jgi:hypothetical protein
VKLLRPGIEGVWPIERRNGLLKLGFAQQLKYYPLMIQGCVNNCQVWPWREEKVLREEDKKVLCLLRPRVIAS